jgi:hypothetical protein
MRDWPKAPQPKDCVPIPKILVKFDSVKFDENLPRIRVDFSQKPLFNANNSFKPVCYGLVQRRWKIRRG